MAKTKKTNELAQQIAELTADLQRTRADFENYRKRVDDEKQRTRAAAEQATIVKLLPIIDLIDSATQHMPDDLKTNVWASGVAGVAKKLQTAMQALSLERIDIIPGKTPFDPERHEAVSVDDGDGHTEVVAQVLQAGYTLHGKVLRPAMVRVEKKS